MQPRRDELDRNMTAQAQIAGAIHVAHAAAPERGNDLVGADNLSGLGSHYLGAWSIHQSERLESEGPAVAAGPVGVTACRTRCSY
jgi:hypothetical protein